MTWFRPMFWLLILTTALGSGSLRAQSSSSSQPGPDSGSSFDSPTSPVPSSPADTSPSKAGPVRGIPAGGTADERAAADRPAAGRAEIDQSEADIFDTSAFDETVEQSRSEEKKESLSYLVGGTLLMDTSVTMPAAFDGYTAAAVFSGRAFGRVKVPSYGQIYLAYNLEHTLLQGVGGSMSASPVGSDLFSNTFALSEFFFDFDIAKRLFVRVGNQLLAWGPSNVWTPVDFVNLQKASTLQPIDVRVGKPGLKLFLPFPRLDFTLFGDFSDSVEKGVVGDIGQTAKIGFRSAATIGGFELGLSGYLGEHIQNRYGFDASGSLFGAVVYGELAMLFPYGSYDFGYSASLGLSRSLGELKRWNTQTEFFYNSRGIGTTSDYPALIASDSFIPLYIGKLYGYAAITKEELFASYLDATLSGIANFSDLSYRAKFAAKLSIPDLPPFTVSLAYGGGGAGKEFTYFTGNNSLTLDLQALIQF